MTNKKVYLEPFIDVRVNAFVFCDITDVATDKKHTASLQQALAEAACDNAIIINASEVLQWMYRNVNFTPAIV